MNNLKSEIIVLLFFVSTILYSQNNETLNIVNSSSFYSNNVEFNTGEIFVIYNFGTNATTSKVHENEKKDLIAENLIKIELYPNPTSNLVYYRLPNDFSFESVEIYDQHLKIVYFSNENNGEVLLERLPTGIYYICFNKNRHYKFQIIKR